MAVDAGTVEGHLDLDVSKFVAGLKTAQSEAAASSGTIEKQFSATLTSTGDKLMSAGRGLTMGVTVPLLGIAAAGLKISSDFDYSMSQVKAISQASGEDFDMLRDKAIQLGADTAFSASEAADAMTEMAKAGWATQDIMDGISGVLDAAAASGSDLATTATIMADAISGFGLSASDSTRVADLLTQAANAGTIGIEDLGESFKYIAPVASSMGYSIEDVTTALTAMSGAGIKGSQAGTGLRTMLTRMVKPTDQVKQAMDNLGISMTDGQGNFKSLDQLLSEMRDKFGGLTDEQKTYYAATLAGQEGMSGLLALLNMSQEEYDKVAASMDNAGGIAGETAATMQDNLKSSAEQLQGSLESLAIKLSDLVTPALRGIVDKATEWVNSFTDMDEGVQKTVLGIAAFAAAVGPVTFVVGSIIKGIGGFISAIASIPGIISTAGSAISSVFAATTAPIAAVVAIIGILVAAFVHLWQSNEDFRNKIGEIWGQIQEAVCSYVQGIQDRFTDLQAKLQPVLDFLSQAWDGFCNMLAPVFVAAFQVIADTVNNVLQIFTGVFDIIVGLFSGDWEQLWQGVKEIFGAVWGEIVSILTNFGPIVLGILATIGQTILAAITAFISGVVNCFVSLFETIGNFLNNLIDTVVNWAVGFVQSAIEAGTNFVSSIMASMSDLPYNIGYLLGTVVGNIILFVSQFVQNAISAGQQFVQGIISFIQDLPTNIWNFLTNVISTVTNWASQFASNARQAGSSFIQNIYSFMQSLPGRIQSFLSNAIGNVVGFVSSMASNASSAASQFASNLIGGLQSIPERVVSIGRNIVDGIANGIRNAAGAVANALSGAVNGAIDGIKHTLGIASPSKLMRDEVGRWMPPGISRGFIAAAPKMVTTMQDSLSESVSKLKAPIADFDVKTKFKSNVVGLAGKMNEFLGLDELFKFDGGELAYVLPDGGSLRNNKQEDRDRSKYSRGDTFNFYSPKVIDEVEAARQMEKTKKRLLNL